MKRRFGIEIECINLHPEDAIDALERAGVPVRHNADYSHSVLSVWKAVGDSSVRGGNGRACEVVSPPLEPTKENFETVALVLKTLSDAGCHVNDTCGFHVHVDLTDIEDGRYLVAMMQRYALSEEKIDKFVSSSRRGNVNSYCMSLKPRYPSTNRLIIDHEFSPTREGFFRGFNRYVKLNPCAFDRQKTIEFRHFHGTLNSKKAIAWIKFCVNFVESSMSNIKSFGRADNPNFVVDQAFEYALQKSDFSLNELDLAKTFFGFLVDDINERTIFSRVLDRKTYYSILNQDSDERNTTGYHAFTGLSSISGSYRPIHRIYSSTMIEEETLSPGFFESFFPKRVYTDPEKVNRYIKSLESICNLDYVSNGTNAKALRQIYWFYCLAAYANIHRDLAYPLGVVTKELFETKKAWRYFFGTKKQGKLKLKDVLDAVAKDFGFKNAIHAGEHIINNNEYRMLFSQRSLPSRNVLITVKNNKVSFSENTSCLPLKFYIDVILSHYDKRIGSVPFHREDHLYKRAAIKKHLDFYKNLIESTDLMSFDSKTVQFACDNNLLISKSSNLFEIAFGNGKEKQNYFSVLSQIFTTPEVTATLRGLDRNKSELILNDTDKWFEILDGLDADSTRELETSF